MSVLFPPPKPALWNISKAGTDPKWDWFHDHCVGAWFPFADGVSSKNNSRVFDRAIRTNNHGTVDNSSADLSLVQLRTGPGIRANGTGTNDRIALGTIGVDNPLCLASKTSVTYVMGWYHHSDATQNAARFFDKSSGGNLLNGYGWWDDKFGTDFEFIVNDGTLNTTASWDHDFTTDSYHQMIMTASKIDSDAVCYINGSGAIAGTYLLSARSSFPPVATSAAFYNWNHSTNRMANGALQYVYILDDQMADHMVRALQQDPFAPFRRRALQFQAVKQFSAQIQSTSAVTANVDVTKELTASVVAESTVSGNLATSSATQFEVAVVSSSGTAFDSLAVTRPFAAILDSGSVLTGIFGFKNQFIALTPAVSAFAANLTVNINQLSGVATSLSALTIPQLVINRAFISAIPSVSDLTALFQPVTIRSFTAVIAGISAVSGDLNAETPLGNPVDYTTVIAVQ